MALLTNRWSSRLDFSTLTDSFMPFFTLLQPMFDLALRFLSILHPLYSLAISIVYFIGSLVQWSIWMNCEISGIGFDNAGKGETCFQVNLDHAPFSMVPSRSFQGVVNGILGLGVIILALYAAYGGLEALAVMRNRRGAREYGGI
ncbi:MAG: hypothetical protein Q9170_001340 [Blastenia crenularia]